MGWVSVRGQNPQFVQYKNACLYATITRQTTTNAAYVLIQ